MDKLNATSKLGGIRANLFLIGASKCGTTFMHELLSQHPDIQMCDTKELWYFQRKDYLDDIDWYQSKFEQYETKRYLGESSPIYSETTEFPDVPRRIFEYNPSSKIIYLIRNPFDRLRSAWIQAQSTGHWAERKFYKSKMPLVYRDAVFTYPPFLEACRYWTHVQNYRKYFEDRSIKVVIFEDFTHSTREVMLGVFKFLDVDQSMFLNLTSEKRNSSEGKVMFNPWPGRLRRAVPAVLRRRAPLFVRNIIEKNIYRFPNHELKDAVLTQDDHKKIYAELSWEVKSIYKYLNIDGDPWHFFDNFDF